MIGWNALCPFASTIWAQMVMFHRLHKSYLCSIPALCMVAVWLNRFRETACSEQFLQKELTRILSEASRRELLVFDLATGDDRIKPTPKKPSHLNPALINGPKPTFIFTKYAASQPPRSGRLTAYQSYAPLLVIYRHDP